MDLRPQHLYEDSSVNDITVLSRWKLGTDLKLQKCDLVEQVLTTVEGFLDEKGSLARLSALKTLQKELRTSTNRSEPPKFEIVVTTSFELQFTQN